MAKSINQVMLMGRLTRDPELRSTTTGKSVVNFSLAVDRYGQDAGADFFDIVAWEKLGELVNQYLSKGRRCLVQGRLSQRSWEGDDGKKRYRTEVVATDVTFLDGPNQQGQTEAAPAKPADDKKTDALPDEDKINFDDIPF